MEGQGGGVKSEAPRPWAVSGEVGEGSVRQWRFLIWSWTIRSGSDDWLVEVVQRRFLGREVVHRYSRTLWMAAVWAALALAGLMAFIIARVLHSAWGDAMALVFVPYLLFCAAFAYFTFVPPKSYRSSWKY